MDPHPMAIGRMLNHPAGHPIAMPLIPEPT